MPRLVSRRLLSCSYIIVSYHEQIIVCSLRNFRSESHLARREDDAESELALFSASAFAFTVL